MTLKRTVMGLGGLVMLFGLWTLSRAHSQVGVCTVTSASGAAAKTGIDSLCVRTLMAYTEGFVFVACGLIIIVIAFTMIARQEKIDLHSELRAVPKTFVKGDYVISSELFDQDVEGVVSKLLLPDSG